MPYSSRDCGRAVWLLLCWIKKSHGELGGEEGERRARAGVEWNGREQLSDVLCGSTGGLWFCFIDQEVSARKVEM